MNNEEDIPLAPFKGGINYRNSFIISEFTKCMIINLTKQLISIIL